MSKLYPRFLYSNPQDTKIKGPFIIHCVEPRVIFKVEILKLDYRIILIDYINDSALEQILILEASRWLKRQLASGKISL